MQWGRHSDPLDVACAIVQQGVEERVVLSVAEREIALTFSIIDFGV
jgi:hypothetical protein